VKILLVAFACHPEWGSESAAGWGLARLLAQDHQVQVITHPENRAAIESFAFEPRIRQNLTFRFFGQPFKSHPNRMVARIMSWVLYRRWLADVLGAFGQVVRQEKPDLIHHATFATWRVGIPWFGLGTPVVWGPMGGAATFPLRFLGGLSFSGATFEIFRNFSTRLGRFAPGVTKSCRSAAAIICGNYADLVFIRQIRGNDDGIHVLSSAHFSPQEMEHFQKAGEAKDFHAPLQAFAGGICIASKGIQFALEALALARKEGTRIHYTVASTGPELCHLQKTVQKLNLQAQVEFHPGFKGQAYAKQLGRSHLFLLPSFREGSPRTILEAMMAGVVPVVCRASAQGEIVDDTVGACVPIGSRKELIHGLAKSMVRLDRNRALLADLSRTAQQRVRNHYSSSHFLLRIRQIYEEIFRARRRQP
jgi:glycosyltransferase involved in cell wall biosynthesis